MRREVVPDHSAVLHYEANVLELVNVRKRIASDGNEVCKSPRINSANPILPAQQFRGVCRDCSKDVARRHSRVM